jgi:hypothetical protein
MRIKERSNYIRDNERRPLYLIWLLPTQMCSHFFLFPWFQAGSSSEGHQTLRRRTFGSMFRQTGSLAKHESHQVAITWFSHFTCDRFFWRFHYMHPAQFPLLKWYVLHLMAQIFPSVAAIRGEFLFFFFILNFVHKTRCLRSLMLNKYKA